MGFQEQRASERFEVEREVRLTHEERSEVGKTVNLSLGGALVDVEMDPPLALGARVQAEFTLPDLDEPVRIDAEVRWVNEMWPARVGIQFLTGFRAKQTWALNRLFDRLRGRV